MNPSEEQIPRPEGMKMTVSKESLDRNGERHYSWKGSELYPASFEDVPGPIRGVRTKTNPDAHVKVVDPTHMSSAKLPQEGINNLSTYITNRAASGEGARVSGERIAKENAKSPKKVLKFDDTK